MIWILGQDLYVRRITYVESEMFLRQIVDASKFIEIHQAQHSLCNFDLAFSRQRLDEEECNKMSQ